MPASLLYPGEWGECDERYMLLRLGTDYQLGFSESMVHRAFGLSTEKEGNQVPSEMYQEEPDKPTAESELVAKWNVLGMESRIMVAR